MTKTTSAVVAYLTLIRYQKKTEGRKRGPQLRIGVQHTPCNHHKFRIRTIDILRLLNIFQFEERSDFPICIDLTNDYGHNPCFRSTKHYVFTDKGIYAYFLLGRSKFMLYFILASKFLMLSIKILHLYALKLSPAQIDKRFIDPLKVMIRGI